MAHRSRNSMRLASTPARGLLADGERGIFVGWTVEIFPRALQVRTATIVPHSPNLGGSTGRAVTALAQNEAGEKRLWCNGSKLRRTRNERFAEFQGRDRRWRIWSGLARVRIHRASSAKSQYQMARNTTSTCGPNLAGLGVLPVDRAAHGADAAWDCLIVGDVDLLICVANNDSARGLS